ncbi:monovalent cation/H(+) antiporter subunit G [Rubrivirga sp.]|uniref:monovalent cation/H(+) antiporter subunit G n=1 Tax=Rubrivirga sp. TaxID=1885344 RepID=UPI003C7102F9
MIDLFASALVLLGAGFVLVAAIGVVRMPDLPMRMHAATKAGTLGAGLILVAVALVFAEPGVTVRAVATVAFLFLTAPISAHVVGRAAAASGALRLWEGTRFNELADDLEAAAGRPFSADPEPVTDLEADRRSDLEDEAPRS